MSGTNTSTEVNVGKPGCAGCQHANALAHQLVGIVHARHPAQPIGGAGYAIARECWKVARDPNTHNHPIP